MDSACGDGNYLCPFAKIPLWCSGNKPVNDCEVIYIATADIAGEGVVYQLRVDPSSGVVDKSSEKSYDGFGRVMDMGWKKQ